MPSVDFVRQMKVTAPLESVWDAVTNVERLATWITVVDNVSEISRLSRYSATLADRLGPFRLSADLDIRVTNVEEGTAITFVADGEDPQVSSRIKIEGALTLVPTEQEDTIVGVNGSYEITGRVATLGAPIIRNKGEKILDQFSDAVTRELG